MTSSYPQIGGLPNSTIGAFAQGNPDTTQPTIHTEDIRNQIKNLHATSGLAESRLDMGSSTESLPTTQNTGQASPTPNLQPNIENNPPSQPWLINTKEVNTALAQPKLDEAGIKKIEDLLLDPETPEINKQYMAARAFGNESGKIVKKIQESQGLNSVTFKQISLANALIKMGKLKIGNVSSYFDPQNRRERRLRNKLNLKASQTLVQ